MSVLLDLMAFSVSWLLAGAVTWALFIGFDLRFVSADSPEAATASSQRLASNPGP